MAPRLTRAQWMLWVRSRLWPTIKKSSQVGVAGANSNRGFLAEGWFCSLLMQKRIPFARTYEASSVDLALVGDASGDYVDKSLLERLLSVKEQKDFLTLDVKYFEHNTDRQGIDYPFRPANRSHFRPTAAYVLVFEGVDDYVGLVPKSTYDAFTDFSHGVLPLVLKVMSWCYPFMVHVDDLATATGRMLAAKKDEWYVNPTTGVIFRGWIPEHETHIHVFPEVATDEPDEEREKTRQTSIRTIVKLWHMILDICSETGITVDMNDIAPLICDFVLRKKGLEEVIRIEHKIQTSDRSAASFSDGRASPFSKNRLWHFLILQIGSGKSTRYCCVPRNRSNPEWAKQTSFPNFGKMPGVYEFTGADALNNLLGFISDHAEEAIQAAEETLRDARPGDIADEELLSSNADMSRYHPDDRPVEFLEGRSEHARGLPWMVPELNEQASVDRKIFFVPMDVGHVWCTGVAIQHSWGEEELEHYRSVDKGLPRHIFDKALQNAMCTPVLFADFSGGDKMWGRHGHMLYPFVMREAYWLKPGEDQQWWTVASSLKPQNAQVYDTYLSMPSELFTQHDNPDERREKLDDVVDAPNSDERCRRYFVKEEQYRHSLSKPSKLHGNANRKNPTMKMPIRPGSSFLKPQVDPLDFAVKLSDGSIYRQFRDLLEPDNADLYITGGNTEAVNGPYSKEQYLCPVRDVLQAMWDYGLMRRPAAKGDKKRQESKKARRNVGESEDEGWEEEEE